MRNYIYSRLLRLDGATLKNDTALTKLVKRHVLKRVGYYFRKKYYNLNYKNNA